MHLFYRMEYEWSVSPNNTPKKTRCTVSVDASWCGTIGHHLPRHSNNLAQPLKIVKGYIHVTSMSRFIFLWHRLDFRLVRPHPCLDLFFYDTDRIFGWEVATFPRQLPPVKPSKTPFLDASKHHHSVTSCIPRTPPLYTWCAQFTLLPLLKSP